MVRGRDQRNNSKQLDLEQDSRNEHLRAKKEVYPECLLHDSGT